LRIKAFFGTSENAVKTQIWIAISAYVLVAIMKKRLKIDEEIVGHKEEDKMDNQLLFCLIEPFYLIF